MVMHARKYPRLNDGYYERNQAHPFEDKYPSKSHGGSYNDRYPDSSKESPNYSRSRDESPGGRPSPRYQSKSSYMERTKERMDKGSSNSPGDKRLNHQNSALRSDSDRPGSSHVDKTPTKPQYKSADVFRDNKPQVEVKDQRAEQIQKNAQRVSGDWSEHISSSGKKYYYNCKSEVSQWEKPKDWLDSAGPISKSSDSSARPKDRNGRDARASYPSATSSKSSDDRYKHSSAGSGLDRSGTLGSQRSFPTSSAATSHSRSSGVYTPSSSAGGASYSSTSTTQDHRQSHHHTHTAHRDGEHRDRSDHRKTSQQTSSAGGSADRYDQRGEFRDTRDHQRDGGLQRIPVLCRSNSGMADGPFAVHRHGNSSRSRDDRHGDVQHSQKVSAYNGSRTAGDTPRNENEDSRQTEDMDISPGSTPTSSRPNSRTGTPVASANNASASVTMTSTSGVPSSLAGAKLRGYDGNDLAQQAIQTLQKLQQALMAQQHQLQLQHQNAVSQSPRSAPDATPPYQPQASPHLNSTGLRGTTLSQQVSQGDEDSRGGRESPRSDRSVRSSRRGSPTPSVASSSISLSNSSLSVATKKQESIQLTPSLSNYYHDKLIEHCINVQADQAERQANRYGEEAHSVGSLHCTQVSVDLKRARSLVRIAEIQATLHEQRVLFLRQQTKELENMRSQNTFMPSQHDT